MSRYLKLRYFELCAISNFPENLAHRNQSMNIFSRVFQRVCLIECYFNWFSNDFFLNHSVLEQKKKLSFIFFLWIPGEVDFKMLKRKTEKCKALKVIEKGLSNKDASKKYGVPPNTVSTRVKNKEKYFKGLEDNCSSKKWKLMESAFEKLDNVVFRWFLSKRSQNSPIDSNLIK